MTDRLPPYSFWDGLVRSLFSLRMIYYLPLYCIFIPKLAPASKRAWTLLQLLLVEEHGSGRVPCSTKAPPPVADASAMSRRPAFSCSAAPTKVKGRRGVVYEKGGVAPASFQAPILCKQSWLNKISAGISTQTGGSSRDGPSITYWETGVT